MNNVSEKVSLEHMQTNGVVEIAAVIRSIQQALELKIKNLQVKSDSKYVVDGANIWIKNWIKKWLEIKRWQQCQT